jgi:hypothetical protein
LGRLSRPSKVCVKPAKSFHALPVKAFTMSVVGSYTNSWQLLSTSRNLGLGVLVLSGTGTTIIQGTSTSELEPNVIWSFEQPQSPDNRFTRQERGTTKERWCPPRPLLLPPLRCVEIRSSPVRRGCVRCATYVRAVQWRRNQHIYRRSDPCIVLCYCTEAVNFDRFRA